MLRGGSACNNDATSGGDRAILDIRKIEDYCLNPMHPRGRHKARVFREALGIQQTDAAWLPQILLEAARSSEALELATDTWGTIGEST